MRKFPSPPGARNNGALLALALGLAALTASPASAVGGRPSPPVTLPPHGPGSIIPLLSDGTLREPSTDRAETVEAPESLATHELQWEITLAGGSTDRIGTLDTHSLEAGHVGLTYGLGRGVDVSLGVATYERTRLDASDGSGSYEASGVGPTTLELRRTVRGEGENPASGRVGVLARFPGAADGPGPRQEEIGASFAVGQPIGDRTQVAGSLVPAWVGDALDTGHHFELAAGVAVSQDLADYASLWIEGVSVSSEETGRPWLGVVDGGVRIDAFSHLGLTLGASAGTGGGHSDVGVLARLSVHS